MSSNKLAKEIDKKILAHYLEMDANGNFKHAPKNDDELWEFVRIAYGIKMPRKVVTRGHSTPSQFVCDLYFERVKNALAFANRTGGKCLALDTPVLTTVGFKQLQDVRVGDFVFSPSGKPVEVLSVSETHQDHECYRINFDSETIVADADHLWEVRFARKQEYVLRTTKEIFEICQNPPKNIMRGQKAVFRLRKTLPLELPSQKLRIHPYVLGVYMGDGCRTNNTITSADVDLVARIDDLYPFGVTPQKKSQEWHCAKYNLYFLREILSRETGYAIKAKVPKFVPDKYLLSSCEQRLELLRGLMDSDGTVSKKGRHCEFVSTDRGLIDAVQFLVASLGGNPRVYGIQGRLRGKLGTPGHRVMFAADFVNPFWLPRKASKVLPLESEEFENSRLKSTDHYIRSIERCDTVPVKCIGVDSADHMFLAGRTLIPTHNTFSVAIINHLEMLFKRKCEIASAGAVRDQADKCYRYFMEFCQLQWFQDMCAEFQKRTGRPFVEQSIVSKTIFGNGARMEIITGTEKGLRGPHPHKARIDEIDLIPWEVLQTGLSMARSGDGWRGQNVFSSTRQLQDGSMQRMLDEAHDKGISVYEWNIWEVLERCPRRCADDPKHGTCPIYTFCKGKAHHCDGFYAIDDFIDKVRLIDRDQFETEWLNSRPSRHKLVYQCFDNGRHVMTPQKLLKIAGVAEPSAMWPRISGLDFGSSPGHPFIYLKLCRIPNVNAWMVFHEYAAEQRLIRDHATAIRRSPYFSNSELIFADWDAQDRLELRAVGVHTRPAVKGRDTVNMGIDYITSLLKGFPPQEIPQLYVWHECAYTIKEFGKYEWPIRPDGKPDRTGNPCKENDHAMDALRYALYSYKKFGSQKYFGKSVPGL